MAKPGMEMDTASKSEFTGSSDKLLKLSSQVTKVSNGLPTVGDNWNYYSSFKGFRKIMKVEGENIANMMTKLLQHQGITKSILSDDLDEMFDCLIEANDIILERINNNIDQAAGIKKNPDPVILTAVKAVNSAPNASWNREDKKTAGIVLLGGRNIQRPQFKFKKKVCNAEGPFIPIITEKPNSLKPLSILLERTEENTEIYSHPYQYELELFSSNEALITGVCVEMPGCPVEDDYQFIDCKDDLVDLISHLKQEKIIGVDLEHHSYRTFKGLTCLMQISTPLKDIIIDTLALRDDLEQLNEVFTDPKIIKVLHGATHDIEWMQRDLGLYIVNMFDTFIAAKVLRIPQMSLSYLLKSYCGVQMNKSFQLADWRIRPLPQEMLKYAREDTHYLPHLYTLMKDDIIEKGGIKMLLSVFDQSKFVCLRVYIPPALKNDHYIHLCQKHHKNFNARQVFALQEILKWRDKVARDEDESLGYVLPNHMLLQLAENLPREMQGILSCCNPHPPLVKQNLLQLHTIILKAREQSLVQVSGEDLPPIETLPNIDVFDAIHCPHEAVEVKPEEILLEKAIDFDNTLISDIVQQHCPALSLFLDSKIQTYNSSKVAVLSTKSPYQRYLEVLEIKNKAKEDALSPETTSATKERIDRVFKHAAKVREAVVSESIKRIFPIESIVKQKRKLSKKEGTGKKLCEEGVEKTKSQQQSMGGDQELCKDEGVKEKKPSRQPKSGKNKKSCDEEGPEKKKPKMTEGPERKKPKIAEGHIDLKKEENGKPITTKPSKRKRKRNRNKNKWSQGEPNKLPYKFEEKDYNMFKPESDETKKPEKSKKTGFRTNKMRTNKPFLSRPKGKSASYKPGSQNQKNS